MSDLDRYNNIFVTLRQERRQYWWGDSATDRRILTECRLLAPFEDSEILHVITRLAEEGYNVSLMPLPGPSDKITVNESQKPLDNPST